MADSPLLWVTHNRVYLPSADRAMIDTSPVTRYLTNMLGALSKSLLELGFMLDVSFINSFLKLSSVEDAADIGIALLETTRESVGAAAVHTSVYPDFPEQVMEASEAKLYLNSLLYYWTGVYSGTNTGSGSTRYPLFEEVEVVAERVIYTVDRASAYRTFIRIMSSKTEFSAGVRARLIAAREFIFEGVESDSRVELKIQNKENLAFLQEIFGVAFIMEYARTATDVLRILVNMAGGDITLARNTVNFKKVKFTRALRSAVLARLDSFKSEYLLEDLVRYKRMWIRLGELLHPGDYARIYGVVYGAFDELRNHNPRSFAGQVDLMRNGYARVELLSTRPGVFARSLDKLLRSKFDGLLGISYVVRKFEEVSSRIDTKVLLQVRAHFDNREDSVVSTGVYFAKGTSRIREFEPVKGEIPHVIRSRVIRTCDKALRAKYAELGIFAPDAKVYIDPVLSTYPVPFGMRSASSSGRVIVRGTRFPIANFFSSPTSVLRLFIHWENIISSDGYEQHTDIDLSAAFVVDDGRDLSLVSYRRLKDEVIGVTHSGDFTDAPVAEGGASEFIDIKLETLRASRVKYVLIGVFNFSRTTFNQMEVCDFGWMIREHAQAGEIFEAKTVQNKIHLSSDTRSTTPLILDVASGELVWVDNSSGENAQRIENSPLIVISKIEKLLERLRRQPNLYTVFQNQVNIGQLVDNREDADFVIGIDADANMHPWDPEVVI